MSIELADGLGLPVLSVGSLTTRPVTAEQLATATRGPGGGELFEVEWSPLSAPAVAPSASADVVVFESESVAIDSAELAAQVHTATHRALARVQSWLAEPSGVLVVLTRGAVALPGEDVADLAGAAVWGLVRSAQTEHPGRIVIADVAGEVDAATLLALGEPQLVVRDGAFHAPRVVRSRGVDSILVPPDSGKPWRLGVTTAGTFDNLALEEVPNSDAPLPPAHIRVELHAVAANFRDVMITLGMFTHDALIGSEAAGVVTEVAADVTDFTVGQRVMGLFPEGTGTVVAADARLIAPIPDGWTDAEAAAVLVVFTTAFYGLRELAAVQPGQSILIHAATGGVGLAAIQLARHWGWRCSPPPAEASGRRCGPWASTTTTSATRARWTSSRSSSTSPAVAASTSCSTRWPVSSSMRRCGCCHAAACSSRWARPTSATQTPSRPPTPACATAPSTSSSRVAPG